MMILTWRLVSCSDAPGNGSVVVMGFDGEASSVRGSSVVTATIATDR